MNLKKETIKSKAIKLAIKKLIIKYELMIRL